MSFSKRRKEVNEMKPSKLLGVLMASVLTLGITSAVVYYSKINKKNEIVLAETLMDPATMNDKMVDNEITSAPEQEVEVKEERIEVYEGMTYDELVEKLNRTLSSDLTNMGYAYATYSLELGVDPYLAVAISMHETGCTWNCSYLLKTCNNVGGQKGEGCGSTAPGCDAHHPQHAGGRCAGGQG